MIRTWSRHSRRSVPIHLSTIAFARGARIGVSDDPDVGTGEHGIERGGEFAVSVADQEPEPVGVFAEVHEQVAGLLGDPVSGGVGGDSGEVHAAAVVLDNHET